MIRVRLWGTRGAIASPGYANRRYGGNTPCVQVIGYRDSQPGAALPNGNSHLILDGGTGLASLQTTLMQGAWGQGRGELHVLLTHYHWDHLIGLPFFAPLFVKGNRVVFYGSSVEDLQSSIEQLFTSVYSPLNGTQNVAADLEYRQVKAQGMDVAGFQVRAVEVRHTAPALAFRVDYGTDGVVYSTDHAAGDPEVDARLVELARGAQLWILDAQFTPEEHRSTGGYGHTSHIEAVRLGLAAGVETLVLFHHDPAHDDEMLDRMGLEAAQLADGSRTQVLMARDGMLVEVGLSPAGEAAQPVQ
jgi:phosphoribosyl 1,2-cyclic phosphodiesterase